jgi:hypothetical protein
MRHELDFHARFLTGFRRFEYEGTTLFFRTETKVVENAFDFFFRHWNRVVVHDHQSVSSVFSDVAPKRFSVAGLGCVFSSLHSAEL